MLKEKKGTTNYSNMCIKDNLIVAGFVRGSRVTGFDPGYFSRVAVFSRVIDFVPGISTCDSILSVEKFFKKNIN